MADEYPSAEVVGTDISAVQPSLVPPNCSFQIDDAQLDWTFKPGEFDFIHIRYLENPKIEKDESHILKKWCRLFFECGRKTGRTWEIARNARQEEYMREAGFTDPVSKSWKLPVGGWPQDKKLK
ncbi:hypothetical protein F52700_4968 [Fusarium sp. NRRL 52700]|nr:hypothetical protein F52700_4968 [Fusarium sp. NRRL 52700]